MVLAVLVCPTVAGFKIVTTSWSTIDTNPLHRLNWTVAQQTAAQSWFYLTAVVVLSVFLLLLLTLEAKLAIGFRRRVLVEKYSRKPSFAILLSGVLSPVMCHDIVSTLVPQSTFDISNLNQSTEEEWEIRAAIESAETSFLTRLSKSVTIDGEQQVQKTVTARYADHEKPFHRYLSRKLRRPRIYELYQDYHRVTTAVRSKKNATTLVVKTFDRATARYLVEWFNSSKHCVDARYVGVARPNRTSWPSWTRLEISRFTIRTLVAVLTVVWSIPLSACGVLSQLGVLLDLLDPDRHVPLSDGAVTMLQGVVPSLTSSLLMYLFLPCLRRLIGLEARLTDVQTQMDIQRHFFVFLYVQQFLTISIAAGCIPVIVDIVTNGVKSVPLLLAQTIPLSSDYFLSYVVVQSLTSTATALLPVRSLWARVSRLIAVTTPRQRANFKCRELAELEWGEIYPVYSTLMVIGRFSSLHMLDKQNELTSTVVGYSLISPFILPLGALAFAVTGLSYRYVIMYRSFSRCDTEGQLYFSGLLTTFPALYTFQLCSLGLFLLGLSGASYRTDIVHVVVVLTVTYVSIQWQYVLTSYIRNEVKKNPLKDRDLVCQQSSSFGDLSDELCYGNELQMNLNQEKIWIPDDTNGISSAMRAAVKQFLAEDAYRDILTTSPNVTNPQH